MKSRSFVAKSSILLAGLCIATAHAQTAPPVQPALVCGIEVYPSPIGFPQAEPDAITDQVVLSAVSGNPCQDGSTVFGPTRFERTTGNPVQEISQFILDADADVCIISQSGDKGKASLFVDGINIAEPEDFDDQIDVYTDSLVAGSHGLGVRAVGKPGGYLDIEVRQLTNGGGGGGDPDLPAPGEVRIDPKTGAVDMVSADGRVRLQNVATDHPLLTPNGDGHHDTTTFQALTTPLVELPGKDDGTVAYFVDWEFQIVDLATCNTIDTGLSGSTQINSPTLSELEWDGTDVTDMLLPPGTYAYTFDVNVVGELESDFGNITSPGFGLVIVDDALADYDELAEQLGLCNAAADPSMCRCPGIDGAPGTPDPNCAFSFVRDLLPEGNFQPGVTPNYYNPFVVDTSFISTTLDPVSGRYTVTVDLRSQNAKGLVPKGNGFWDSEASLRQWVKNMTGVPLSTDDSLFNFDYVQIGTSRGVSLFGPSTFSFNHFFLDAMTDDLGRVTVGGLTTDLKSFNDDSTAPAQYVVAGDTRRDFDECTDSGNTDGDNRFEGKFCAYNSAVSFGNVTDLGIYMLRTTTFDFQFNNKLTEQDILCVFDIGIFHCGVRTNAVPADTLTIKSSYYRGVGLDLEFSRTETTELANATGMSTSIDRAGGEGGVCSRAVAVRDGLAVRMDAADGSVPDTCIINGIF